MGKIDEVRHYNKEYLFFAESTNFGELGDLFDIGDEGSEESQMYSQMEAEQILIAFLRELDDRQKVIVLLQVIKSTGFKLNQNECASILSVSKDTYKDHLMRVRDRLKKIYSASKV